MRYSAAPRASCRGRTIHLHRGDVQTNVRSAATALLRKRFGECCHCDGPANCDPFSIESNFDLLRGSDVGARASDYPSGPGKRQRSARRASPLRRVWCSGGEQSCSQKRVSCSPSGSLAASSGARQRPRPVHTQAEACTSGRDAGRDGAIGPRAAAAAWCAKHWATVFLYQELTLAAAARRESTCRHSKYRRQGVQIVSQIRASPCVSSVCCVPVFFGAYCGCHGDR